MWLFSTSRCKIKHSHTSYNLVKIENQYHFFSLVFLCRCGVAHDVAHGVVHGVVHGVAHGVVHADDNGIQTIQAENPDELNMVDQVGAFLS